MGIRARWGMGEPRTSACGLGPRLEYNPPRTKHNRRRPTPAQIALASLACVASYILGKTSNGSSLPFGNCDSFGPRRRSKRIPDRPANGDGAVPPPPQRYAVANFVEGDDQIYGAYSIHRQLLRFGMIQRNFNGTSAGWTDASTERVVHVAIVPDGIDPKYRSVLNSWLGEENVRTVDQGYVLDRLREEQRMWKGTFNKLWMYNLTEFDKVIMFDTDVLVRSNVMHWFDYSTPCGIQHGDDLNWNSGAMVIRPDTELFERMLATLPRIQRYNVSHVFEEDPLNSGYSDQDFVSAFFLTKENAGKRCVMPTENAVLDCSIQQPSFFDYYNKYRPWVYQAVHFACSKPWRGKKTNHPFRCEMYREWKESMSGIQEYYDRIPPLGDDYLADCPNQTAPQRSNRW